MRIGGLGAACYGYADLYQIALNAGFPADAAGTMAAIALGESGGCPSAYNGGNPPGAESSYGLWQINVKGNPTLPARLGITADQLYDPNVNARAAALLYNSAGFAPWSVYNSGAYLAYLPQQLDMNGDPLLVGEWTSNDPAAPASDSTTLALGLGLALLVLWAAS